MTQVAENVINSNISDETKIKMLAEIIRRQQKEIARLKQQVSNDSWARDQNSEHRMGL